MEGMDLKLVYDAVLSSPGMNDVVKLDFKITRKLILLMVAVIERGVKVKGAGLPESVDADLKVELIEFIRGSLDRADLTALYDKLKQFDQ